ncbi:IS110 family transposase [Paenibacillus cremeus]|uniref:IS110 family transposase n=1 Tax=Paenibacillus cremeus TaxID=2163881 RepID=A0A559JK72_9BACL|nr:IS110 family transposase [Paenibacillus cremeus]
MIRQHEKLTMSISNRKRRIQDLVTFAVPLLLDCFEDPFTLRARLVFKKYFHPARVKQLGVRRLASALLKGSDKPMHAGLDEQVYAALMDAYELYGEQEFLDFDALSDEMTHEIEMLEQEEKLLQMLNEKIYALYEHLHPSRNLETIPGIGKTLAPVMFAIISNPGRFSSTEGFRSFTGMIPGRSESGLMEGKGGKMTKAGPPSIRRALYLAADVARQWDPQIAKHYYEQMVLKGNQHVKATCAIATKMASRVLRVLKEDVPYEIRDVDGTVLTRQEARQTIVENWMVPDTVRKRLRKKK